MGEDRETVCYRFGDFRLEAATQLLLRHDEPVHLAARPFEILTFLIENRSRVVGRSELLEKFWDGHNVYDDALRKTISTIRHALDDTESPWRYINTQRGSGFRFVAEVNKERRPELVQELTPHVPLWRARFVLLTLTFVILLVSSSFAVRFYLRRTAEDQKAKIPKITSIAILPLRNLTGDAANDYLSEGLSDGLISEFSRNSRLRIISRSSSFSFKDKDAEPREIADKLKVDAILEGSLQKAGDEIRADVRLVDARTGDILWTNDTAKSSVRNAFATQSSIACEMLAKINAGNCARAETVQNVNPDAYRAYMQGTQLRGDLSLGGLRKSEGFYEQALTLAPDFAAAHEALATTYVIMESNGLVEPSTVIPKAEFHANEALRLDEKSVDALLVLSETKTSENYDLELRESLLRRAVEQNPNHSRARMWLANLLTVKGKFDEAEKELLYAQQIDPLSYGVRLNLSELYFYWRKPEKVLEQAGLLQDQGTVNHAEFWLRARAYLQLGDVRTARDYWDKLPVEDRDDTSIEFTIKDGEIPEAQREIEELARSEKGKTSPYRIGCLYSLLGEKDTAFKWLERSYEIRQTDLISLKVDPALDGIRDDARYATMVSRVNLAD